MSVKIHAGAMHYGNKAGLFLLLIFCTFALRAADPPVLTLVKDRTAQSEIVVGERPVRAAQFAALELQYAVKRITGCTLDILPAPSGKVDTVLYVGASAEAKALGFPGRELIREQYLIDYREKSVFLMGNDKEDYGTVKYENCATFPERFYCFHATTYAVYDFIEEALGVRYYGPGDLNTVCPESATLEVTPFRRFREPSFDAFRCVASYRVEEGMTRRDYQLLLLRWRLNSLYGMANHSTWGIFWRYWGKAKSPDKAALFIEKRHQYFASGHAGRLASLVGPEYPDDPDLPGQLCLLNPGTLEYFIWEAVQTVTGHRVPGSYGWRPKMEGYPHCYAFQEDDNPYYCRCEECRKLTTGKARLEQRYKFINKLAEKVSEASPGSGIATLSYSSMTDLPDTPIHPAVSIMMCLSVQSWYHPGIYARQYGLYRTWVEKEGKKRPLMVWTYMLCPAHEARLIYRYNKFFPFLYPWKTAGYFKQFAADGIRGWFGEINLQQHMLEGYVAARIAYDSSVDPDRLIDEYFEKYYGQAGPDMKKFYRELEEICWNPDNMSPESRNKVLGGSFIYGYHTERKNWHYGTPERMRSLQTHLDNAEKHAATPEERARVDRFKRLIWNQAVEGRKEFEEREKRRNKPVSQAIALRDEKEYDGNLDDVPFENAVPLPEWQTLDGESTDWKPEIRLFADSRYLYLRYAETGTPAIARGESSFWSNNLEVFLAKRPGGDVFQIAASPHGKTGIYESRIINGAVRLEKIPDGLIRVKNVREENHWTVTMAVPFAQIPGYGGALKSGDSVCANIFRSDFQDGISRSCAWSPIYTNDYREGMLRPGLIFLSPSDRSGPVDINGSFRISPGSAFPDQWREFCKETEKPALRSQDGIVRFQTGKEDLKRYRYLVSTLRTTCKPGDRIVLSFQARGKGRFASGLFCYYDRPGGLSFLDSRSGEGKIDSPEEFIPLRAAFTVQARPGQIPGQFAPVWYAFPGTVLELKDVSVEMNPPTEQK